MLPRRLKGTDRGARNEGRAFGMICRGDEWQTEWSCSRRARRVCLR